MITRRNPQARVAIHNLGRLAGNGNVSQQAGHQARTHRRPMHGTHNRLVAIDHVVNQVARLFPDTASNVEISRHVFHQRQVATTRKAQTLTAQHCCSHAVVARNIAPNFSQFRMPFVACGWQFAIAPRPTGFHLDVQHGLIGTSACDVQGLVTAVVDGKAHGSLLRKWLI